MKCCNCGLNHTLLSSFKKSKEWDIIFKESVKNMVTHISIESLYIHYVNIGTHLAYNTYRLNTYFQNPMKDCFLLGSKIRIQRILKLQKQHILLFTN